MTRIGRKQYLYMPMRNFRHIFNFRGLTSDLLCDIIIMLVRLIYQILGRNLLGKVVPREEKTNITPHLF